MAIYENKKWSHPVQPPMSICILILSIRSESPEKHDIMLKLTRAPFLSVMVLSGCLSSHLDVWGKIYPLWLANANCAVNGIQAKQVAHGDHNMCCCNQHYTMN